MLRSLVYRVTAIFMAILLLFSTTGISMDMHYCQDQLKGISLFGEAKSCHEKKAKKACNHASKKEQAHGARQASKKDCCHNETVVVEKSDLDATNPHLSLQETLDLNILASFSEGKSKNHLKQKTLVRYEHYKPPLPDREFTLLYQTFLI